MKAKDDSNQGKKLKLVIVNNDDNNNNGSNSKTKIQLIIIDEKVIDKRETKITLRLIQQLSNTKLLNIKIL